MGKVKCLEEKNHELADAKTAQKHDAWREKKVSNALIQLANEKAAAAIKEAESVMNVEHSKTKLTEHSCKVKVDKQLAVHSRKVAKYKKERKDLLVELATTRNLKVKEEKSAASITKLRSALAKEISCSSDKILATKAKCKMALSKERFIREEKLAASKANYEASLERKQVACDKAVNKVTEKAAKEEGKSHARLEAKQDEVDAAKCCVVQERKRVSEEKSTRKSVQKRHAIQVETMRDKSADEKKKHEAEVGGMADIMNNLLDEVKEVNKLSRAAAKKSKNAEEVASSRLENVKALREKMSALGSALDDEVSEKRELEKTVQDLKEDISDSTPEPTLFKKVMKHGGKRGGAHYTWPLKLVQMIMEMLVNGTPPASIAENMLTMSRLMSIEVSELPSDTFIRECRTYIQIVCTTLVAYQLGLAKIWGQLFSDGTSRKQISLQNLVLSFPKDGKFRSLILSTSKF